MSIDFVIIPASKELEEYAYKVKSKLEDCIFVVSNFQIDTNFNLNLNSRINKWKKDDFDIIVITPEFIENNNIFTDTYNYDIFTRVANIQKKKYFFDNILNLNNYSYNSFDNFLVLKLTDFHNFYCINKFQI